MKTAIAAVITLVGLSALAAFHPTVTDVVLRQEANNRVYVSYALDEDAIVTVDFLTNGVSIGASNIGELEGVGIVSAGTHEIVWRPARTWAAAGGADVPNVVAKVTAYAKDDPPDYLVVDLTKEATACFYATTNDFPFGFGGEIYKTDRLVMKRVRARNRSFAMGSALRTAKHNANETAHTVSFAKDFYLGIYQLTQKQCRNFCLGTSFWPGNANCRREPNDVDGLATVDTYPMTGLTYTELRENTNNNASAAYTWPEKGRKVKPVGKGADVSVLGYLNKKSGLHFDLPTEAEWEYVCRAGHGSDFGDGTDWTDVASGSELGWTNYNSKDKSGTVVIHGVGLKKPNDWGFYDMHGNCDEWCLDWYAADFAKAGGEIDPTGPVKDEADQSPVAGVTRDEPCRIRRGGHYNNTAAAARGPFRSIEKPKSRQPNIGFRVWAEVNF